MSQIWASQASADTFYTGLTGVRREHRRQGLATALKVASISSLSPAPDGKAGPFVRTQNLETNPMLPIMGVAHYLAQQIKGRLARSP